MHAKKALVECGDGYLPRVPCLCSLSIIFTACVTKSGSTKSFVTGYSIFEFPASFRLVVFKFRCGCRQSMRSNSFKTNETGSCCAVLLYSKIHKQNNTRIISSKDLVAGVLECEFGFIKYRRFAGHHFFLALAYWSALALLAFNSLLTVSRRPAQFGNVNANRSAINPNWLYRDARSFYINGEILL